MVKIGQSSGSYPDLSVQQPVTEEAPVTQRSDAPTESREPTIQKEITQFESSTAVQDAIRPTHSTTITQVNSQEILQELDSDVMAAIADAGSRLGNRTIATVQEKLTYLRRMVLSPQIASPQEAYTYINAMLSLEKTLSSTGLYSDDLITDLNSIRQFMLSELGRMGAITIEPVYNYDSIVGIETNAAESLSQTQVACWDAARLLIYESERLHAMPQSLTMQDVVLLDLRDSLMRKLLETQLPKIAEQPHILDRAGVEKSEFDYYTDVIGAIDNVLAEGGQLSEDILIQISDLSQSLQDETLPAIGSALNDNLEPLQELINGDQSSISQIQEPLNSINTTMLQVLANTPHDITNQAAAIIDSYTVAMNGVETMLPPPVPFTYVLPQAIGYNDGNGQIFLIPAGSQIRRDFSGGTFIEAPSLFMQTGDTYINAGQSTIRLGGGLDELRFDTLDIDTASTDIDATNVFAQINRDSNTAMINADSAIIDMEDGSIIVQGASFSITDSQTSLQAAQFTLDQGDEHITTEDFQLSHVVTDTSSAVSIASSNIDIQSDETTIFAEQFTMQITRDLTQENVQSGVIEAHGVSFSSDDLDVVSDSAIIAIQTNSDGSSTMSISGEGINITTPSGEISGHTQINLNYDTENNIEDVSILGQQLQYSTSTGDTFSCNDGALAINFTQQGFIENLTLTGENIVAQGDFGEFACHDQLLVACNCYEDGSIAYLDLQASQLEYINNDPQPTNIAIANAHVAIDVAENGSKVLTFKAQDAQLQVDQVNLSIDNVASLVVQTNDEGAVEMINASFPGMINFESDQDGIQASITNLQGSYDQNKLMMAFTETEIQLISNNMQAVITDGDILVTEQMAHIQITDAQLLKQVEDELQLDCTVHGLDLLVSLNQAGQIDQATLQFEDLTTIAEGFSIIIENENNQYFRLETTFNEDDGAIQRVFWELPEGGEIEIASDDFTLQLGPHTLALTDHGDGHLQLESHDLDLQAAWQNLSINVDSDTIDVALDPDHGLVFNKIHGTNITIASDEIDVDVDIQALDNLMLRMTGISGLAQGAMLELIPTGDDSEITARISTSYEGLPIVLNFDNLSSLQAAATLTTNEVRVWMADPGNQGTITADVGPLRLEGHSSIDFHLKYLKFDPMRMLNAIGRFMNDDGIPVLNGVSIESDGVIRMSTPRKGLYGELAVLLPRGLATNPGYIMNASNAASSGADLGGFGLMANIGGSGATSQGTRYSSSLYFGLMPGSYFEFEQKAGNAYLFGVPLPKRGTLPTTATAGLKFEMDGQQSRLDAHLGAFVNPAYFLYEMSQGYLSESYLGGANVGIDYRSETFSASANGVIQVNEDFQPTDFAVQLMIGLRL